MQTEETTLITDDRRSLGTRVSWGAIFCGVVIVLSLQFLLTLLGAASGLSLSDRVSDKSIQTGAVVYLALTIFASLFVGGVVTSLLTGGENKQEAVLSGFVMWGAAFLALLFLGSAGVQNGANVFTAATNTRAAVAPNWEETARQAGVTDAEINNLKANNSTIAAKAQDPAAGQEALNVATRATWYGFFITWISMLFAAGGAYAGSGPMFRVITIKTLKSAPSSRLDGRSYGAPAVVG